MTSDPRNKPIRHVLVVDDVPEIGAFYLALFRRLRSVHVVPTFEPKVQNALARLSSERYDLVITDMRMPDGSGDEVIAAARRSLPGCPIVLMTGYVNLSSREGLTASLTKPLDTERTLRLLTDILSPSEVHAPPVAPGVQGAAPDAYGRGAGQR